MKNLFTRLNIWSLHWASTKWGAWALFICAFADASFLPLPTPVFFLTLALLHNNKAYRYALFGTFGTFFGAMVGYAIGHFAWLTPDGDFTRLAQFLFNSIPGFSEASYSNIHIQFAKWNIWILFMASFIPIPYKIFSISAGVFDINFFMFCIVTLISQGIKFFVLGFLIIKIGPEVKKIFEFKLKPIAIIITACITIAIIVIKVF